MKRKLLLLTFILSISVSLTKAAIVYTDVVPDTTIVGDSLTTYLDVDMNNDGTPDYRIAAFIYPSIVFMYVQAGQIGLSNFVLSDTTGGFSDVIALPSFASIGSSSATWSPMSGGNAFLVDSTSFFGVNGQWGDRHEHYMGVKFTFGSNYYYGWIRLEVSLNNGTITLKDYAYNDTPDAQVIISVNDIENSTKEVNVFQNNEKLNFTFDKSFSASSIELMDLQGKKIKSEMLTNAVASNNANVTLDVTGLTEGVYVYRIISEEGSVHTGKAYISSN